MACVLEQSSPSQARLALGLCHLAVSTWTPVPGGEGCSKILSTPLTFANWLPPYVCWYFLAPDTHIKVVHFAFTPDMLFKNCPPTPTLELVSS